MNLIGLIQSALDEKVPGARIDARQLDTGKTHPDAGPKFVS